jgi:hypothetical protein
MATFTIGATDYRTSFFGANDGSVLGTVHEQLRTGAHAVTVTAGGLLDVRQPLSGGSPFVAAITGLGQAGTTNAVWTVNVNGAVNATSANAGDMMIGAGLFNGFGATANRLTVGVDGTLHGADYGLASSARGTITNNGWINGQNAAIWFGDVATLGTNTYTQGSTGSNLFATAGAANGAANLAIINTAVSVTNAVTGVIETVIGQSSFNASQGVAIKNMGHTGLTVTNAGYILSGGTDTIYNGQLVSNATTHVFGDHYDGAIYSAGRLTVTNAATGIISGSVSTEWFGATVTNAGLIGGVEMRLSTTNGLFDTDRDGDFADTITAAGGIGAVDVTTLVGLTLTNSGFISSIRRIDELTRPDGRSSESYSVVGADARDTVRNTGTISEDIYLQGGADLFANTGALARAGDVFMGAGNDTITNTGTLGTIWAEAGNDSLSNTLKTNTVHMGEGNDTVTNSGTMEGNPGSSVRVVEMADGNDSFTNSGTIGMVQGFALPTALRDLLIATEFEQFGFNGLSNPANRQGDLVVAMGADDDTLNSTGTINGWITMGEGRDVMTGGANRDYIIEDDGLDRYSAGAGADQFYLSQTDAFADTIDGGLGTDFLFLGDRGFTVNLALNTLRDTADTRTGNTDTLLNVERVRGGVDADVIIGSARAESLAGGAGADAITGGGGKDILIGGLGNDVFVFNAASDSTVARAGRDMVLDFNRGQDDIQLTFDANTLAGIANAGIQQFDYAGIAYGNFTREGEGTAARFNAGELRYDYEAGNTILRGDTNGDGLADFAIEFRGLIAFDATDFIFGTS